ncbi:hypothetical protein ACHQM5_012924 [Ranunculus cassubicifolius]
MCHEYVSVKNYKIAYSNSLLPLPNQSDWNPPSMVIKPPPLQRPPGRPRKNRRRGADEGAPTNGQSWTRKRINHCRKCGQPGHNKSTCKGLSAEQLRQ